MTVSAIKLIQPGEIQGMPEDDTPLLVVMDARQVFQDRATRLAQLAATHTDSAWLGFAPNWHRPKLTHWALSKRLR